MPKFTLAQLQQLELVHKTEKKLGHSEDAIGIPDPLRLLEGRMDWWLVRQSTETNKMKKTLILTDWSLAKLKIYNEKKYKVFVDSLVDLVEQGFELYIWEGKELLEGSVQNIAALADSAKMINPQALYREADNKGLERDNIAILDYFKLREILNIKEAKKNSFVKNVLDFYDIKDLTSNELDLFLTIIPKVKPLGLYLRLGNLTSHTRFNIFFEMLYKKVTIISYDDTMLIPEWIDLLPLKALASLVIYIKPNSIWNKKLSQSASDLQVKNLEIRGCNRGFKENLNGVLSKMPNLETIRIVSTELHWVDFNKISLTKVKKINLRWVTISLPNLLCLLEQTSQSLEEFSVDSCHIVDEPNSANSIINLPSLKKFFYYQFDKLNDLNLSIISAPNLKELDISVGENTEINFPKNLIKLKKFFCSHITNKIISFLNEHQNSIEQLFFKDCFVNLKGQLPDLNFKVLKKLFIQNCIDNQSDWLGAILKNAKQLKKLILTTDRNDIYYPINHLPICTLYSLKELKLENVKFTLSSFLNLICKANQLEELTLSDQLFIELTEAEELIEGELSQLKILSFQYNRNKYYSLSISASLLEKLLINAPLLKELDLSPFSKITGDLALLKLSNLISLSLPSEITFSQLTALLNQATSLKSLSIKDKQLLESADTVIPCALASLECLTLSCAAISAEQLYNLIGRAANLKELTLFQYKPKDSQKLIYNFPQLKMLNLTDSTITVQQLDGLIAIAKEIERIYLNNCALVGRSAFSCQMPKIKILHLNYSFINSKQLNGLLSKADNLEELSLIGFPKPIDNFSTYKLRKLKKLNLTRSIIDAQQLGCLLANAVELEELNLEGSNVLSGKFSACQLPKLKVINAEFSFITSPILNGLLSQATLLEELDLSSCENLKDEFPSFKLLKLKKVRLPFTITGQQVCKLLEHATELEELSLANCIQLGRKSSPCNLSSLKKLNLSASSVTASQLSDLLVNAHQLRELNLEKCSHLSGILSICQLSNTTSINLTSSSINAQQLGALLNNATRLEKLNLNNCTNLTGDLSVCHLDSLKEITGEGNFLLKDDFINASQLSNLIKNSSHLEKISLTVGPGKIEPLFLPKLKIVDLSGDSLDAESLGNLIYTAHELESLNLSSIDYFSYFKPLVGNLPKLLLPKLKKLSLRYFSMTCQQLYGFLNHAPLLERLTFDCCLPLQEDLPAVSLPNLRYCKLSKFISVQQLNTFLVSASSLQQLILPKAQNDNDLYMPEANLPNLTEISISLGWIPTKLLQSSNKLCKLILMDYTSSIKWLDNLAKEQLSNLREFNIYHTQIGMQQLISFLSKCPAMLIVVCYTLSEQEIQLINMQFPAVKIDNGNSRNTNYYHSNTGLNNFNFSASQYSGNSLGDIRSFTGGSMGSNLASGSIANAGLPNSNYPSFPGKSGDTKSFALPTPAKDEEAIGPQVPFSANKPTHQEVLESCSRETRELPEKALCAREIFKAINKGARVPEVNRLRLRSAGRLREEEGKVQLDYTLSGKKIEVKEVASSLEIKAEVGKDYYLGRVVLNLMDEWQALPSLSVNEQVLGMVLSPLVEYELGYCSRSAFHYIRAKKGQPQVTVSWVLEAKESLTLVVSEGKDYSKAIVGLLSGKEERALDAVTQGLIIELKALPFMEKVKALHRFFCDKEKPFGSGELEEEGLTDDAFLARLAERKIGSCEQRVFIYMKVAGMLRITEEAPSLLVGGLKEESVQAVPNDCHIFIEAIGKIGLPITIDLGGYAATLNQVPFNEQEEDSQLEIKEVAAEQEQEGEKKKEEEKELAGEVEKEGIKEEKIEEIAKAEEEIKKEEEALTAEEERLVKVLELPYDPEFALWETKPVPKEVEDARGYARWLLENARELKSGEKTIQISCANDEVVELLHDALLEEMQEARQGECFFVKSLKDIRSKAIKVEGNDYEEIETPGQQFVQQEGSHVFLLNWSDYEVGSVGFQSLMDRQHRSFQEKVVNAKLVVLVCVPIEKAGVLDEDFHTRFKFISEAPSCLREEAEAWLGLLREEKKEEVKETAFKEDELRKESPREDSLKEEDRKAKVEQEQKQAPDLAYCKLQESVHWERVLVGRIKLKEEGFTIAAGQLKEAIDQGKEGICLVNPPWELADFRACWRTLSKQGIFYWNGEKQYLPAGFKVSYEKAPYELEGLEEATGYVEGTSWEEVLNSQTFSRFFEGYKIDNVTKKFSMQDGLLERNKDKSLSILVTETLEAGEWALLLAEAKRVKCKLEIKVAYGVELPLVGDKAVVLRRMPCVRELKPDDKVMVYTGSDLSHSEYSLRKEGKIDERALVIPVSEETRYANLVEYIEHDRCKERGKEKKLLFTHYTSKLIERLIKGKTVVLKGNLSSELAQSLASIFASPGFLWINGKKEVLKGKLIILSQENPFCWVDAKAYTPKDSIEESLKEQFSEKVTAPIFKLVEKIKQEKPALTFSYRRLYNILKRYQHNPSKNPFLRFFRLEPEVKEVIAYLKEVWKKDNANRLSSKIKEEGNETKRRCKKIVDTLDNSPHAFLVGSSGTGKTTFIQKELRSYYEKERGIKVKLFMGEKSLEAWTKFKPSEKEKAVFCYDEANFANPGFWDSFSPLFTKKVKKGFWQDKEEEKPYIYLHGKKVKLSKGHKVIGLGNFSYFAGRKRQPFWEEQGEIIEFKEFSATFLKEKVIDPAVKLLIGGKLGKEDPSLSLDKIADKMIEVYNFVNSNYEGHPLTPRNLHNMVWRLRYVIDRLEGEEVVAEDKVIAAAFHEVKRYLTGDIAKAFEDRFKYSLQSEVKLIGLIDKSLAIPSHSEKFLLTESRYPIWRLLNQLFYQRQARQEEGLLTGYGAQALLVEGLSGIGKTGVVEYFLEVMGIAYVKLSASDAKLEEKLLEHFHKGSVVMIDEINTCESNKGPLEELLNSLLSGITPEGEPPAYPGVILLGTLNPTSFAGRLKLSEAVINRVYEEKLTDYPDEELVKIARHIDNSLTLRHARLSVESFRKTQAYAREAHKEPVPNSRNFIDKIIEKKGRRERQDLFSSRCTEEHSYPFANSKPIRVINRLAENKITQEREEAVKVKGQALASQEVPLPKEDNLLGRLHERFKKLEVAGGYREGQLEEFGMIIKVLRENRDNPTKLYEALQGMTFYQQPGFLNQKAEYFIARSQLLEATKEKLEADFKTYDNWLKVQEQNPITDKPERYSDQEIISSIQKAASLTDTAIKQTKFWQV